MGSTANSEDTAVSSLQCDDHMMQTNVPPPLCIFNESAPRPIRFMSRDVRGHVVVCMSPPYAIYIKASHWPTPGHMISSQALEVHKHIGPPPGTKMLSFTPGP